MSKHPTPEQVAAFDQRYMARRQMGSRPSGRAPDAPSALRSYEQRQTERRTASFAAPRTEAPPMTTPTRPLRTMTPAEIAAAGYHPYELPAEQVTNKHVVFGRTLGGSYLVAMTPAHRRELLEVTETGRKVLAEEAHEGTATFARSPGRGRMSAARRAELLGATAAGRQVLEEEQRRK